MATIVITTKLDAKLAKDMKQYCLDHGPEGKSLQIMDFIAQAIREKLDRQ